MRISDWSSDVCSSDLQRGLARSANHEDPDDAEDGDHPHGGIGEAHIESARRQRGYIVDFKLRQGALCHRFNPRLYPARCPRGHWLSSKHRSEEQTSELQSLMRISYAVFCLNKKK